MKDEDKDLVNPAQLEKPEPEIINEEKKEQDIEATICLSCHTITKGTAKTIFASKNSQGLETVCKLCKGPARIGTYQSCLSLFKKWKTYSGSSDPEIPKG